MQLCTTFRISATADAVFESLLDLERVARCMPGVDAEAAGRDTARGRLALRIAHSTVAYTGEVEVVEVIGDDTGERRVRLRASGQQVDPSVAVEATVSATVRELDRERCEVEIVARSDGPRRTTGGTGSDHRVINEAMQRLCQQFARNLEATVASAPGPQLDTGTPLGADPVAGLTPDPATEPPASPAATPASAEDTRSRWAVVGSVLRHAAPAVVAFALGVLFGRVLRRT